MMQEIKPINELPIGLKIYAFGFANCESIYCITSPRLENGTQEMCLISNYYEDAYFAPVQFIDEYSRGISEKFGIGFYYDDVDNFSYSPAKIAAAIRRAKYLTAKIIAKETAQAEADRKELENLPALYPHLRPITNDNNGYQAEKWNLVQELKKHFPDQKFSFKKGYSDSIDIYWTDGLTEDHVREVSRKFVAYENDWSGDFRDYAPSNFNRVFGGFKYVSENREMSPEVEALKDYFNDNDQIAEYERPRIIRQIWWDVEIPKGAKNFRLEPNGQNCGQWHEFFDLKFDVETQNEPQKKQDQPEKPEKKASKPVADVQLVDYSDKSFAVIGETKAIKDTLKELGGRFNMYLKCGAGWIFPNSKKQAVIITLCI